MSLLDTLRIGPLDGGRERREHVPLQGMCLAARQLFGLTAETSLFFPIREDSDKRTDLSEADKKCTDATRWARVRPKVGVQHLGRSRMGVERFLSGVVWMGR